MQKEEEEGVDRSKYLASHREQESSENESQAAVPRSSPDSEEDDKGRRGDLHGRPDTGQAEAAANRGAKEQLCNITKLPIVDKQGRLLTHQRSRAGGRMGRAFQRSSEQTTTNN